MSNRYSHLLSPVEVGNVLLKNRMTAASATPHFIQGTEKYPTEKWITLIANRARSGASAVCINHLENGSPQTGTLKSTPEHFSILDFKDTSMHNYLCQMIDAVRFYGSVAMYPLATDMLVEQEPMRDPEGDSDGPGGGPGGPGGGPGGPGGGPGGPGGGPGGAPASGGPPMHAMGITQIDFNNPKSYQSMLDDLVKSALFYKTLGFQMLTTRVSQFSHANVRFCTDLADALKQSLGRGYPIEFYTDGIESGVSVKQNLELAQALEGKIDILTVRYGVQDWTHPTGFTSSRKNPSPCTELAAILTQDAHERGAKLKIGVSAGIHNPEFAEHLIAAGKADMIVMARTWICEPEYLQKLVENRGEDVVPCVRCNKCHVPNDHDKFRSFCTVNPRLGMEEKIDRMIRPISQKKKVAVIGGGPGGLYAAITLADRNHDVTLYEQKAELGGQLTHADYPSFKWPLADYKNWLIAQVKKRNICIKLNTRATREALISECYDAAIVAVGAVFKKASIPGAENDSVILAIDAYGNDEKLPHKLAIIGGSETGVETGMYLAEKGHDVTVFTRQKQLASDAAHAHYRSMVQEYWEKIDTFHGETDIQKYNYISENGALAYTDKFGNECIFDSEMVIMATGASPNTHEAAALYGICDEMYYIGDCHQVGDVHFAVMTAYGAANQI